MQNFINTFIILSSLFCTLVFAAAEADSADQACVGCHQSEQQSWQKSDHAKAMAIADKHSVIADFTDVEVSHHGQKARFYQKNGQFFADISYDEKLETLPIRYTFGHYPLQQYLVETSPGKFQVLPFAWDARSKTEGGQRWYHNYANEEIRPEDRLHWRQPLQNWNGMCADCHSDGLKRNYDAEQNSFNSEFTNINVGCASCHADLEQHLQQQANNGKKPHTSVATSQGHWQRNAGQATAQWVGEKRDNSVMDNCFSCHSLRAPLTDGITPGKAFLDQFTPQLLQAPSYHVDGQIKEEVYVYGSFLQSKMFAKGVNCLDCHDKHTMKIKIPGNGLCLQCHASDVFNSKQHHRHQNESAGAQCVNCHMTENRYMGVDDRRDHSFKIPRPELSEQFSTPNACTTCHQGKSNEWALDFMKSWQIKPRQDSNNQKNYWLLKSGKGLNIEQHLSIIADDSLDIISRATALQMLTFTTEQLSADLLRPYLTHKEQLLRLAAANVATLINPGFRAQELRPLLTDPLKAIRAAAARAIVDVYIPEKDLASFNLAFVELTVALEQSSWRGEGRLNQGMLAMAKNDNLTAEQHFKQAIKVEPYFDSAYSNLAELYRTQGKVVQLVAVYNAGISKLPKSAILHYGFALHLVRQQQLAKALPLFKKAMLFDPTSSQYAYVYALATDSSGDTKRAISLLKTMVDDYSQNQQLVQLGLSLAQKAEDRVSFDYFMARR